MITTDDVRAKLGKIDRSKLSEGDRDLLDAAQAIAGEVVAPPAALAEQKPAPVAAPTTKECPYCFSIIPLKATRCPNCTSQL